MALRPSANYNGRLTSYAGGLSQAPTKDGLADFIAPKVVTGIANGQFKRYTGRNALQVVNTLRALGGPAARIKLDADDPFYNCKPNALEIPIDDAEYEAAGDAEGAVQALQEAKAATVVSNAKLARELTMQAIVDAITPVASVGVWSNAANDPIAELDAQIMAITTATGIMPNRLAIGLGAWVTLRNHPKVIARQPNAANVGVSLAQLSAMLCNPNIECRLGILSKDTAKIGNSKNAVNVFGAKVLVFIGNANPTIYDPSFMKTFSTKNSSVDAVRTYREESTRSEVLALDWSEDVQTIFSEAAKVVALS